MGSSSGTKQVRKYYDQAGNIYDQLGKDIHTSPLYMQGKALADQLMADPWTYSPEFQANTLASMFDQGQAAYDTATQNLLEQVGAAGGLRQGATRGELLRMGQGLGQHRADAVRQMATAAREARSQDINNALAIMNNIFTTGQQHDVRKADMLTGAASNPIWAQPSPLQSIVGSIGGAGLGMLATGLMPATGGLKGGGNAALNGGLQRLGAQQMASTMSPFMQMGARMPAMFCWVAEAIFGVDHPKTHAARHYVNNLAPAWVRSIYGAVGKQVAWCAKRSSVLRWALRPLFESFARKGAEAQLRCAHG